MFCSLEAGLWHITHSVMLSTRVLPCWYSEPTWHFRHWSMSATSRRCSATGVSPPTPTTHWKVGVGERTYIVL